MLLVSRIFSVEPELALGDVFLAVRNVAGLLEEVLQHRALDDGALGDAAEHLERVLVHFPGRRQRQHHLRPASHNRRTITEQPGVDRGPQCSGQPRRI